VNYGNYTMCYILRTSRGFFSANKEEIKMGAFLFLSFFILVVGILQPAYATFMWIIKDHKTMSFKEMLKKIDW
jgi:hypothetical protein